MSSSSTNRTSYNRNNNQTQTHRQDMNRSRSSHRNNSLYNSHDNYRSSSYDRASFNRTQQKTRYDSYYNRNRGSNIEDDYVDCKAILDDECKRTDYVRQNRNSEIKRTVNSPMKRNNNERCHDENMQSIESPKKRQKGQQTDQVILATSNANIRRFNLQRNESPKRSTSLCEATKKSFASTPKSERRTTNPNRVRELMDQNSMAIERNMSNNWADIIEELEEQSRELNSYVDKVTTKYKLDKEKLLKNLEKDTETLRKRQKRINFGKVTAEYQRYILALPRKQRQPFHPKTPNKFRKCSRRKFDGQIKKWRKLLHVWDDNPELLPEIKHSIEDDDEDITDDFGGASLITNSDKQSYNLDDYDILDSDSDDKLVIDAIETLE